MTMLCQNQAKTIDLCNNPKTKEPKLSAARRILPEWEGLDQDQAVATARAEELLLSTGCAVSSGQWAASSRSTGHESTMPGDHSEDAEIRVEPVEIIGSVGQVLDGDHDEL
jgi:hypothetical protein